LAKLEALGYRGVNVTVPHKEAALKWCRRREPVAERLQAANTIRFRDKSCINTDLPGIWDTLSGVSLPNRKVLVLGAGGSARSVVLALSQRGFEIAVWNRTRKNAAAMIDSLKVKALHLEKPCLEGASLVINTTSSSLEGVSLPVAWDACDRGGLAYDLMYSDGPTPFMVEAANHGLRTMDGRPLLAAQGARSFEYWLDMRAPRDAMLQAIQ
jgi:shikimate dehydrogenase